MNENVKQQKQEEKLPLIDFQGASMTLKTDSYSSTVPVISLPDPMIQWIDDGRNAMYRQLSGKNEHVEFFSQHLPMVTTYNSTGPFPFNCGNKGVGYMPKPEKLEEYTQNYRDVLESTRNKPWQKSLQERLAVVSDFIFNRDVIDYRCLVTLEIFQKQTFTNLCNTPIASLLYTGSFPTYTSYQVNCGVEVITPDDPRHEFIMLSRIMFEYDSFHIAQSNFPYAYLFWVSEVLEKTPYQVADKPENVTYLQGSGNLEWDENAILAVNQAPGMIRKFIRERIEKYAVKRGFERITLELVQEAKKIYRS